MFLYITQNSYYFLHKNFHKFLDNGGAIIYVRRKRYSFLKSHLEMMKNFGLKNFLILILYEIIYRIRFFRKYNNVDKIWISEDKLNRKLDNMLNSKKFSKVISIGCPCKIDVLLAIKHNIQILNLHGGIIPYQRGKFSPIKAILNDDLYLGATLHEISDSFDSGRIISQSYYIRTNNDYIENYNKVLKLASKILYGYLNGLIYSVPDNICQSLKFN
tara:strand:+ start:3650 stop:4297 length:648 start_codon:yes stop_codon:yes gene_type:complete